MRRILFLAISALIAPATSKAIELRWASGSNSLNFTGSAQCTLVVQAGAGETRLPDEWRLLWSATGGGIRPILVSQLGGGSAGVADIDALVGPASAADSSAQLLTAYFSADGAVATMARYVLDVSAGVSGKFKAVALDPGDPDSVRVLSSQEVSLNGGVQASLCPVLLHAIHIHGSEVISIRGIGDGLTSVDPPVLVTRDGAHRVQLTVRSATGNSFIADGVLNDALSEAELQATVGGRPLAAVPVTPDVVLGAQPASISYVPFRDPDADIQPRDFAFVYNRVPTATPNVWRSLFHIIYTTLVRSVGPSSQTTFRHTWTSRPDIATSWHTPVVTYSAGYAAWDRSLIYAPSVVYFDGTYRMFYTGVNQLGAESIGATFTSFLDTTNTVWEPPSQIMTPLLNPPLGVLKPGWVAEPSNGFPGTMRDPYALEDPDHPGNLLLYYVAGNRYDQVQISPAFFRNAVGVVRSQGANLGLTWTDLGYFRSTDGQHGILGNDESPHVFPDNAHADPRFQAGGLWRLMFTDGPADPDSSIRFEVALGSISDTLLSHWAPTETAKPLNLFDYLHQDFTVYGWEATEYLHVAPADFLGAYDGAGINISRMYWTGTDFILGFPDVSVRQSRRGPRDGVFTIAELSPGSGRVRFRIDFPRATKATLCAYDVMGRKTRNIVEDQVLEGNQVVTWDGRDDGGARANSGVYFVRLAFQEGSRVLRVPLVH